VVADRLIVVVVGATTTQQLHALHAPEPERERDELQFSVVKTCLATRIKNIDYGRPAQYTLSSLATTL
jgi:hypothetical protein